MVIEHSKFIIHRWSLDTPNPKFLRFLPSFFRFWNTATLILLCLPFADVFLTGDRSASDDPVNLEHVSMSVLLENEATELPSISETGANESLEPLFSTCGYVFSSFEIPAAPLLPLLTGISVSVGPCKQIKRR